VSQPRVAVTFSPSPEIRRALHRTLDQAAQLVYVPDDPDARIPALSDADAVLAWSIDLELAGEAELALLDSVGLVQLLSAGVDHVPFDRIPGGVPVASNAGAYADPMAEHVLAMALALAKRLPQNHAELARGVFDQETPSRSIRGSVVGVLGFGGIGQASAGLFRALGAHIHALNRSGKTAEVVDWIGSLDELEAILTASDILVVSLPLTQATRGLIAGRELSLMKPDAILVNVARAAILDEDALYEHLRDNPGFSAGIDAWWQEPHRSGRFATRHPFLELLNVIGSPHNSAITAGSLEVATRVAAENVARFLAGEPARHIVDRSEYVE
jgi:phosphoglycerate dehydrogenase-like enzyme